MGVQLRISHRTVGHHLGNVFAKLGINTRTELSQLHAGCEPPRAQGGRGGAGGRRLRRKRRIARPIRSPALICSVADVVPRTRGETPCDA
ncbi:LuxR C-terminal-related transcriptional regulator [Streptomyces sp. 43Y-GA-1]|uniref:LuxR C-terminal-related transcriptional regulator n=1 Tax=Streptomyces sp. 43Y-GA-1 TaxID=2939435 RepID=UPI0020BF341E|nr:LuxR C-terminal-related transcriptional regulator [Streptomyces sp. 43Y-GA-1]MCL6288104.1 LuxR C-terminal-related transcriptional regulator [Streptomyces sp. 43Y-GA-1]